MRHASGTVGRSATRAALYVATIGAVGALFIADADAQALVPGPGDSAHDAALATKMDGYERQIHGLLTVPLGWGLEGFVAEPASRQLIDDFIASGERDFQVSSGLHPYEVIERYGEFADLGMFGGVQAAGDAFRYAVLRDEGAPEAEVAIAREHLLRAMDGLHWYHQVTGEPGVVARGLRRIEPEAGEPPLPDEIPEVVPLFDAAGNPQPAEKEPTWRADNSGELPFLIWMDDTSKDQFDGYIFALGAVYDVVADDPTIPDSYKDALHEDALAIGSRLMEVVPVGTFEADLVLMDADGRPTSYHDLSAEEVAPNVVFNDAANGFNGIMALGAIRTLYHITGDEALGRFYRYELVDERGYFDVVRDTVAIMYTGASTNYSNVNMAFVAAYNLLRYENDPELAQRARAILRDQLYRPGMDREAFGLKQSFFDLIFAAYADDASEAAAAAADASETLAGWPAAPYWQDEVTHCDDSELDAGSCEAEDGSAIEIHDDTNWHDLQVAQEPLAAAIRPSTNFAWRTDPHLVNGASSDRLNPGGGIYAAYWMGRFLELPSDGLSNVSPLARDFPPPLADDPEPDPPEMQASGGDDGCGCRVSGVGSKTAGGALALLAAGLLLARRAPRRRRPS